jgi:bifunctional DNA-binding transcriptional regulator/antitoxin component of YhaV-PrlF toxin-antitoxin module
MARSPIPPTNATLTKVSRTETVSDGGGGFVTQKVVAWQGSVPAYARQKVGLEAGSSSVLTVEEDTLTVPSSVPVDLGDTVEFTSHGASYSRRVDSLEGHPDYGFTRLFVTDPG